MKKTQKDEKKRGTLYAVANSHLDTQWNWTVIDTINECIKNTLTQNLELIKKYPNYRINFEGAFRYALMKEYYPELYAEMKKAVKKGNWIPVGGMWDSTDVNVPSSEGLMRQILYGNEYFEKEFGKFTKDIFLPDCFGFRAALPSIAAHMGLSAFSTQKLVWGVGAPRIEGKKVVAPRLNSKLPQVDLGRWRGPDGKEIFVSLLSGNYTYNFNKDGDDRPVNSRPEIEKMLSHNEKVSGVAKRNLYYGTGDYGGACSDGSAKLLNDAVGKHDGDYDVVSASTTEIYESLTKEEIERLPVYEGGLLIPHGYGAMTSHAELKRFNRRNEILATEVEKAAVSAMLKSGYEYPRDAVEKAYKVFLWHQFHDDITGTSIATAYDFSHNDLILAQNIFATELTAAVASASSKLNTKVSGQAIVVYNPCAFERHEVVTLACPKNVKSVVDPSGKSVLSSVYSDNGNDFISFTCDMKPLSFKVFALSEKPAEKTTAKSKKNTLENDFLRVEFNKNGDVCGIFDKKTGKQTLREPIILGIYNSNSTTWPSWELNCDDLQKEPAVVSTLISMEKIDASPVFTAYRITKKYGSSTFTSVVTLAANQSELRFDYDVDWFEKNSLLTARFPLTAENGEALFDSGLGAVKGGNTVSYPYFVHNVHQWADLTDKSGEHGVTIANNCKYCMGKPDDGTLTLMLIHTPSGNFSSRSGQNFQDFGKNYFSFTYIPHDGKKLDASIERAEALNEPLSAFKTPKHSGSGREFSLLRLIGSGITVRAIKMAQNGKRIIVRLQETAGRAHKGVRINTAFNVNKVFICDGFEREQSELEALRFDMGKYECKTIAIYVDLPETEIKAATPCKLPLTVDMVNDKELPFNIPAEMAKDEIISGGVHFGNGSFAARCDGQVISVPEGTKTLRLLMGAIKNDVRPHRFGNKTITVSPMNSPVGSWESVVSGTVRMINHDKVAAFYTHVNKQGTVSPYDFAYIFEYDIDASRIKSLTLPKDKNILVFAAVSDSVAAFEPALDIFERAESDRKTYKLTVDGIKSGGNYTPDAMILLDAPVMSKNGVFESFVGDGITLREDNRAIVKMPAKNITIKAIYKKLGNDLALGKPVTANGSVNNRECPEKAVDGNPYTKWCAAPDENGICYLTVDLGKAAKISSYAICHAGSLEGKNWNTRDFEVLTRVSEKDEWTLADKVEGNNDDYTIHEITPVKARFVMLKITAPTSGDDTHARIYQIRIFA